MDLTHIDFTKKENQTFKNWFALMWQNGYIITFSLALAGLVFVIFRHDTFDSLSEFFIMILLTSIPMVAITYKGFIQFWNDMKKGTSR